MLIDVDPAEGGIAILRPRARAVRSDALEPLTRICRGIGAQGKRAVVLDMSRAGRIPASGLAALVELMALHPTLHFGFCGFPARTLRNLERLGLERAMPVHPSVGAALSAPEFAALKLAGTQAVLLCAENRAPCPHLPEHTPTALLDVLGKPVLQRAIDRLRGFGVRDFIVTTGQAGAQISACLGQNRRAGQTVLQINDGGQGTGGWWQRTRSSGSGLIHMQAAHNLFSQPFIVSRGTLLCDADLAAMMEQHRATGAAVTYLARRGEDRAGTGASLPHAPAATAGIYIFSPDALEGFGDRPNLSISRDILPQLSARKRAVIPFRALHQLCEITDGPSYYAAVSGVLRQAAPLAVPTGREVRPGVWVHPEADISARAGIVAPCYIGAGARVGPGARVIGPAIIGAGCVLHRKSLVRDSLILPGTHLGPGARAEGAIVSADGEMSHRIPPAQTAVSAPPDHGGRAGRRAIPRLERLA